MENLLAPCAPGASRFSRPRIGGRLLMSEGSSVRPDGVPFLDCFYFYITIIIYLTLSGYIRRESFALPSYLLLSPFPLRPKSSLVLFSPQSESCTCCSASERANRCFRSLHAIIFRTFHLTHLHEVVDLHSMPSIAHSAVHLFSRYSNVFEGQYISAWQRLSRSFEASPKANSSASQPLHRTVNLVLSLRS